MFYDELAGRMGIDVNTASFLTFHIGFKAISVQGRFKIEYFSSVKIILGFGKQKLYVYGQNLNMKNMDRNEMIIVGDIFCTSAREVQIG